jgi:hypothetical protein
MTITATQMKAARGLLGWSRLKLSVKSDVGVFVIGRFESGLRVPRSETLNNIIRTLEAAGIMFANTGKPSMKPKGPKGVIQATWDPPPASSIENATGQTDD